MTESKMGNKVLKERMAKCSGCGREMRIVITDKSQVDEGVDLNQMLDAMAEDIKCPKCQKGPNPSYIK